MTLDAGSGYDSYQWSNGATTQTITVNTAGRYAVVVSLAGGCKGSADTSVTVHIPPSVAITPDGTQTLCDGDSVQLSAPSGFASYQWSSGEKTESIWAKNDATYWVRVIDSNGCTAQSNQVRVVVNPLPPLPTITYRRDTLFSTQATNYQWYRDSILIPGATRQQIKADKDGRYTVTITDANGCSSTSDPFTFPPAHMVWLDTVSSKVGETVQLTMRITPPLTTLDNVTGYHISVQADQKSLFATRAISPDAAVTGEHASLTRAANGAVTIDRTDKTLLLGSELFTIEVQALVTAQPVVPVQVLSAALIDQGSIPSSDGLVLLSGCEIGQKIALDKKVEIRSIQPNPIRGEATITYRAPKGSLPVLAITNVAGQRVLALTLPEGDGTVQSADVDVSQVSSGVYQIELRAAGDRSILPVMIVR
jgi:hypothetical protein